MDAEQYLKEILLEIKEAKSRGKPGVYRIHEKVSNSIATYVRNYLQANTPYRIEFKRCPGCTNVWDILIIF